MKSDRTALDPSFSKEDYLSEANLAVQEGRIKPGSRNIYALNRQRDISRRRGRLVKLIAQTPEKTYESTDYERRDLAIQVCRRLWTADHEAFAAEILRAVGFSASDVSEVLRRTPGHVTRLRRRAREIASPLTG